MGEKASLSVQQIADADLQRPGRTTSTSTRQIAQLRSEAMEAPDRRAGIIRALEECVATQQKGRAAGAASKAITAIMTVSMLEMLQGD